MNGTDYYFLAFAHEEKHFQGAALADFVHPIYVTLANGEPAFRQGAGSPFQTCELLAISHLLLGAVSWSAESHALMRDSLLPSLPVKVTDHLNLAGLKKSEASANQLSIWVQRRLREAVGRFALESTKLQRSLIAIRQEHEKTQLAFSALETYFINHGPAGDNVSFSADATSYYYPEGFSAAPLAVSQLLPVFSQGFAGIELFFTRPARQYAGHVTVCLKTLESESVFGHWEVDFARLNEGWNLFALPETPGGAAQSLRLDIGWHPAAGDAMPSAALSWHQPLKEYRLQAESDDLPPLRSLAFRCRSSMPGLRMPVLLDAFYPNTARRAGPVRARYSKTFKNVVQVGRSSGDGSRLVQSLDDDSRLLVHPAPEGVTIAVLSTVCPQDVTRVSAKVKTEHEEAGDVCYSIALVPKRTEMAAISKALENPQMITAFSGWHVVKPGAMAAVHLMTQALTEAHHVLLMTKLPPGASTENAWATFHDIEFFSEALEAQ